MASENIYIILGVGGVGGNTAKEILKNDDRAHLILIDLNKPEIASDNSQHSQRCTWLKADKTNLESMQKLNQDLKGRMNISKIKCVINTYPMNATDNTSMENLLANLEIGSAVNIGTTLIYDKWGGSGILEENFNQEKTILERSIYAEQKRQSMINLQLLFRKLGVKHTILCPFHILTPSDKPRGLLGPVPPHFREPALLNMILSNEVIYLPRNAMNYRYSIIDVNDLARVTAHIAIKSADLDLPEVMTVVHPESISVLEYYEVIRRKLNAKDLNIKLIKDYETPFMKQTSGEIFGAWTMLLPQAFDTILLEKTIGDGLYKKLIITQPVDSIARCVEHLSRLEGMDKNLEPVIRKSMNINHHLDNMLQTPDRLKKFLELHQPKFR